MRYFLSPGVPCIYGSSGVAHGVALGSKSLTLALVCHPVRSVRLRLPRCWDLKALIQSAHWVEIMAGKQTQKYHLNCTSSVCKGQRDHCFVLRLQKMETINLYVSAPCFAIGITGATTVFLLSWCTPEFQFVAVYTHQHHHHHLHSIDHRHCSKSITDNHSFIYSLVYSSQKPYNYPSDEETEAERHREGSWLAQGHTLEFKSRLEPCS